MTSPALAEAIKHWDALLAERPPPQGEIDEWRGWMEERNLAAGGRPLCNVLRPHLVEAEDFAHQADVAGDVVSAVYRCRDALLADEALRRETLGARFSDAVAELLELEKRPVGDGGVMRADASLARTQLHFIELNSDMPQGMGHNDGIAELFERMPVFERFRRRYEARPLMLESPLLDTLLAAWDEFGGDGDPRIATVSWRDDDVRWSGLQVDTELFRRRGHDAVLRDPRELSFSGGELRDDGGRIDVVHRIVGTAECLARRDDVAALIDAVRAGAVAMVNPFRSELLGNKAIFDLLTDPERADALGLAGGERRAIRGHVPWTRVMRERRTTGPDGEPVDLVEFVRANRERVVLKPSHDFGGHGVHLGWREDDPAWDDAVAGALAADYIVQHRVELHREEYPTMDGSQGRAAFYEDTDPFVFDGAASGMLTRLSPSEITNVHADGGVVASFLVRERRSPVEPPQPPSPV